MARSMKEESIIAHFQRPRFWPSLMPGRQERPSEEERKALERSKALTSICDKRISVAFLFHGQESLIRLCSRGTLQAFLSAAEIVVHRREKVVGRHFVKE